MQIRDNATSPIRRQPPPPPPPPPPKPHAAAPTTPLVQPQAAQDHDQTTKAKLGTASRLALGAAQQVGAKQLQQPKDQTDDTLSTGANGTGKTKDAVETPGAVSEISQNIKTASAAAKAAKAGQAATTVANEAMAASEPPGLTAKGIGVIGVAAGAAQTAQGIYELTHGDVKNGLGNTAAGGTTTGAGVLAMTGSKAAPPIAAAASIYGGVNQVINGKNTEDKVVGGVKTAGGAIMAAGLVADGTVLGAPAGVVANAVGGAMILGATGWENRAAIAHGVEWAGGKVADGAKAVTGAVEDGAKVVGDGVASATHAVEGGASAVGNGVASATHAVGDVADGAKKKIGHILGGL